jgi:ABC-type Mn2+/Zn2+ transport system permease subunit
MGAWLTDPWAEGILQRAFLEVVLLGVVGGALGCWIVLYSLSYSAESLAHGLFPGLVVAALIGAPLLIGGAVGIAIAAGAVTLVGRLPGLDRDVGVAVVVTTLFGLGVLLALSPESPPGVQSLLFGDILGLATGDLILSAALAVIVPGVLWLLHGRLLAVGFDRATARAMGVSAARIDAVLLLLVAVAIMVAVQGLGNLLVVALLVAPAATARLVTRRAAPMMAVAAGVATLSGIAGLYLSYYAGTAAGASIAAVLVGAYLVAGAAAGIRSLGTRRAATIG